MTLAARRILTSGVASAALLAALNMAHAASFGLHEQGAVPIGMAFAGGAAGGAGVASMFWNPATITDNPGWQSSFSVTGIFVYAKETALPGSAFLATRGSAGDVGRDALLPSSYQSYQFNDNLWLGLSINAPFGLVTKAANDHAGGIYGRTSKVFSTDITPTIGYRINDWFSVGAGVQILYFKTRLTSTSPAPGGKVIQFEGNDWGIGYTLGATFKPLDGTEIGIGYRSRVKENLGGTLVNFPFPLAVPPESVGIKSNLTLPDQISIGVKQRVNDQLTLAAQFEWAHWRLFNQFPVVIASAPPGYGALVGVTPTTLGFHYRNSWFASIGGEYKYDPRITLRAGIAYERTPINDTVRGVRLPDVDRIWANLGASYNFNDKLTLDFGYAHIFPKTAKINIVNVSNPAFNPAAPIPYVGNAKAHIDIVSLGATYRWDDPKTPIAAPLVRKY